MLINLPDITECMYVISMTIMMHQRSGASPNFENFPNLVFAPHPLSYTLLALSWNRVTKSSHLLVPTPRTHKIAS